MKTMTPREVEEASNLQTRFARENPDITTVNSANRNAVRKWLTAMGAPYSVVGMFGLAQLQELKDNSEKLAEFRATIDDVVTPTAPPLPEMSAKAKPTMNQAAALQALQALLAPPQDLDEARVIDLIREHAPTPEPREWKIKVGTLPEKTISRQHYKFPLALACVAARVPAYLVGPAGTGKTSAAHGVSEALGLPFAAISIGPMTSKGDLFGMRDAHGVYHESDLVKTARDGGVFLFDEFDAGNPGVLTAVNMLLANGHFSTPNGMVTKSPDFVPLFALNTYGTGASREYVGRNQLDAATLDRGAFIEWPLDPGLEASFVGVNRPSPSFKLDPHNDAPTPETWLCHVERVRDNVAKAGLRHIISPRATLYGVALAAVGVGMDHLTDMLLVKGLDASAKNKILV
jgi:cobaltochelatase CobS